MEPNELREGCFKRPITEDVDSWFRLGRGHGFEFYATDNEVQEWLLTILPAEYAPYRLVGADSIKEGRIYVEHPFSCKVGEFLQCRQAVGELRTQFWLLSTVLTPALPLQPGAWLTAMYSYNGLINIQHGWMQRDPVHRTRPLAKTVSAIGLVDRVYHRDTNEVRRHEAYLHLFNIMKRAIRKSLVYTSLLIGPDDVEQEQVSGPFWTEGARQEYEGGLPFMRARPGPRVSESREAKNRR